MPQDHKFTKISHWIMYYLGRFLFRLPVIMMVLLAMGMLVAVFMIFFLQRENGLTILSDVLAGKSLTNVFIYIIVGIVVIIGAIGFSGKRYGVGSFLFSHFIVL